MRQALEIALEALEVASSCIDGYYIPKGKTHLPEVEQAITAIKEALAQPEQEPVAFYVYKPTLPRGHLGNVSDGDLPWVYDQDPSSGYSARMLVYTTPPQRKPLTDEGIREVLLDFPKHIGEWYDRDFVRFIRAIEAAHGIKE